MKKLVLLLALLALASCYWPKDQGPETGGVTVHWTLPEWLAWNERWTYPLGARAFAPTAEHPYPELGVNEYVSLQPENRGNPPGASPEWWALWE